VQGTQEICEEARDVDRTNAAVVAALTLSALLAGCGIANSPHPKGAEFENAIFTAFQERSPKYLDPTASYSNNETPITYQVYEAPFGYHYLKRPFELIPRLAEEVTQPYFLDKDGNRLPVDAPEEQIAISVYDVKIKKGVKFAPHPAFATDEKGDYLYHALTEAQTRGKRTPFDFEKQGTRELTADDFVYATKRHATTRIIAPISAVFSEYIVGLKEYMQLIENEDKKMRAGLDPSSMDRPFLDFRNWPLEGATAPDRYTFRLKVKGKYPQMKYWMAMVFFAPVPWEADKFYANPGLAFNGLSLNTWPVGTGPFMLTEYIRDRRHVMRRNPNFRGEPYPCEGEPSDKASGFLQDCGKMMPFVDTIYHLSEKEKVPMKAKYLAGFLDIPEIERPEWGVELNIDKSDSEEVEKRFTERGYKFPQFTDTSIWYFGFNMLDPVVGKGDTPEQQIKNRKLRQAISIALDWEEYSRVFPTKGGEAADGPVPPGIFGSKHGTEQGINPITHIWKDGRAQRRPLEDAKKLLAEAGYPGGRDAQTGRPLVLNYDFQRALTPEFKAEMDWYVKQFAKLNIQLEIRATDFNQYQDKKRKGALQLALGGWLADYPDSENFLFLLYGPNASAKFDGDNLINYENPEYDKLFRQLKFLDDGPEKQKLIDQMIKIVREDAPWSFGYYPFAAGSFSPWVYNGKASIMIRDMAKYYRIDAQQRAKAQREWNNPTVWPVFAILALLVLVALPAVRAYRRREAATGVTAGVRVRPAPAGE
jgi:ABC-type transport system substrate-binding protein